MCATSSALFSRQVMTSDTESHDIELEVLTPELREEKRLQYSREPEWL